MSTLDAGFARARRMAAAKQAGADALSIEQVVQAREYLRPADFNEEVELNEMAFLRYRYMTPYERTEEFYAAYRRHYDQRCQKRNGRSPHGQPAKLRGLSSRDFTSAWRARQRADAMGMPYNRFILAFFDAADEAGTKHVPALNQLCSDEKLPMVCKRQAELISDGRIDPFEPGFDPRFYAVNHVGDSQQRALLDMIEAEVTALGPAYKAGRLAQYMKFRQLISEQEATMRFGPELVEAAKDMQIGMVASPVVLDSPQPTPPACIGLYCDVSPICMQCPAKNVCVERAATIDAQVLARYGTLDVPAQRIRDGNRERKQRERERKRTGKTMTDQEHARILREAGDPKAVKAREEAKRRRDAKKAAKAA